MLKQPETATLVRPYGDVKAHPNRQWLLSPIRFLRCQFRRLEAATRT